MDSISEKRKRVIQIINRHAGTMTGPQLDKAVSVWDRLAKSEISQPLPVLPNHEKGKWAAKTDAINDRSNSETEPKTDGKKDDRPVNRMHWRVKHPDGRVFSYTMHPNGAMSVALIGAQQTKTYTLAEWTKIHHTSQDNNKEKPPVETITKAQVNAADTELDRIQKALPPLRWGQTPRFLGEKMGNGISSPEPQRATPAAPAPSMGQNLRESRINISRLDGHSQAALRQGVDLDRLPAGTDLTKMDKGQMASLARTQLLETTKPLFLASGKLYRR